MPDLWGWILGVLALCGAGAAVRSSLLRANAQAWREHAEQRGAELGDLRRELAAVKLELHHTGRDLRQARDELGRLRERYIQVLEERAADLHLLVEEVRREMSEVKRLLAAGEGRLG